MRARTLVVLTMVTCGCQGTTTLSITVALAADAPTPNRLIADVYDVHGALLPPSTLQPKLPGRVEVAVPGRAQPIRVVIDGYAGEVRLVEAGSSMASAPGQKVARTMTLAAGTPDADADGVPDAIDNCPSVANFDQSDASGIGIGDACRGGSSDSGMVADLAGADLAGADLAGADLAGAPGDMTPTVIKERGAATVVTGASPATTITLNTPFGTTNGDVLVATMIFDQSATNVTAPPAGWMQINDIADAADNFHTYWYWHRAGANEPSSYSWTYSPQNLADGILIAYSGVTAATSPLDRATEFEQPNTGPTYSLNGISLSNAGEMLVVTLSQVNNPMCSVPPTGTTKRGETRELGVFDGLAAKAGATGPLSVSGCANSKPAIISLFALMPP